MKEKASIEAAVHNYKEAIKSLNNAIGNTKYYIDILIDVNYSKPDEVGEMYQILSEYYEKEKDGDNSLKCIQKVSKLFSDIYDADDKRVIKIKRKMATLLLKN